MICLVPAVFMYFWDFQDFWDVLDFCDFHAFLGLPAVRDFPDLRFRRFNLFKLFDSDGSCQGCGPDQFGSQRFGSSGSGWFRRLPATL